MIKHLLDYLQFDRSLVYSKAETSNLIAQKDLGFFVKVLSGNNENFLYDT